MGCTGNGPKAAVGGCSTKKHHQGQHTSLALGTMGL